MPATIRCFSLAFAWLLTACPWPVWEDCIDGACLETGTAGTTAVWLPTVPTTSGELQTVTGDEESTGTSGIGPATAAISTTTGEPLGPPAIVEFMLAPNPIAANGAITVTVSAEHADGVKMQLDDDDPTEIDLGFVESGVFSGEISVLSALANKDHIALLTPWRDKLTGAPVEAPYTVKLPELGTQLFWENSDAIGPGQVAALGVTPTGEVIEFGTHYPQGAPRCYLRRRNKAGKWTKDTDLASILPNTTCTAIDMHVDDQGAMFVLASRQGPEGPRWWMAQIPAWGLGAAALGTGAKDETAVALAHHASGMLAVCGYAPTPLMDDDAMVRLFRPKKTVEAVDLDYKPAESGPHKFYEQVRDCVFLDENLVFVGAAFGPHAPEQINRERQFILRLDTETKHAEWIVTPLGVKTQSGAQAIDIDDKDRLVVAGYICDDACQPEGKLWIYDTKDSLVWQTSLGGFSSKASAVQDLTWSLAGYAVVATGGPKDDDSAFTVRAYAPTQVGPLWTFTHKDIKALNMAYALAIGRYGEVYAGGSGADGFPAVAYIGG